jgi:hypothetical protein
MNRANPPDRPLNDVERDRMDAMLSRFRSESAMNNAEQINGFFAALICSPEIARPSQYLPEIWGGEMADEGGIRRPTESFLGTRRPAPKTMLQRVLSNWPSSGPAEL